MNLVYTLHESTEERGGLLPHIDVCATLSAAMEHANSRAGIHAGDAGEWKDDEPFDHGHRWREVPGIGWQHIFEEPLHGSGT